MTQPYRLFVSLCQNGTTEKTSIAFAYSTDSMETIIKSLLQSLEDPTLTSLPLKDITIIKANDYKEINSTDDIKDNDHFILFLSQSASHRFLSSHRVANSLKELSSYPRKTKEFDSLQDLSYFFDEEGTLRHVLTNKAVSSLINDKTKTDELNEVVKAAIFDIQMEMLSELNFKQIRIPLDYKEEDLNQLKCSIFVSKDWKECSNLMLVINGSRGVQPGIWSRDLLLQEGLQQGSMLPAFKKMIDAKYGIIVFNPFTTIPIKGSSSPNEHTLYVWDMLIKTCKLQTKIFIFSYSIGARLTQTILIERQNEALERIKGIVFVEAAYHLNIKSSSLVLNFLNHKVINFKGDNEYLQGHRITELEKSLGCVSIAVNYKKETSIKCSSNKARTINLVLDAVFDFFSLLSNCNGTIETTSHSYASTLISSSFSSKSYNSTFSSSSSSTCSSTNSFSFKKQKKKIEQEQKEEQKKKLEVQKKQDEHLEQKEGQKKKQENCYKTLFSINKTLKEIEEKKKKTLNNRRNHLPIEIPKPIITLNMNNFTLLKVIGKGYIGKVFMIRKIDDQKIYAMKMLKKVDILKEDLIEHIKTERIILELINHPFISRLRYAFQTNDKLYLVTDYCKGGDLFHHLQKQTFSYSLTQFYTAEIVLALEHLHAANIVYRDLKPENILIDEEGHIRLVDFGLSKLGVCTTNGAKTLVGSYEYLAPEVYSERSYGQAIDWWALGVLLYEMLTGEHPFYDLNQDNMIKKIRNSKYTLEEIPKNLPTCAKSLLKGLLEQEPELRLGCNLNFPIRNHPFFNGILWDDLFLKKIPPPRKPNLSKDLLTKSIDFNQFSIDSLVTKSPALSVTTDFQNFTFDPSTIS